MGAANSKPTAPGRPFEPGVSGNPSGRPKGIGREAKELVGGDPTRLLRVLLNVAEDKAAKNSDRIAAAREYLDRAWGKAPAFEPVKDGDPLGLDDVQRAIDEAVDELASRRKPPTVSTAANGKMAQSDNGA